MCVAELVFLYLCDGCYLCFFFNDTATTEIYTYGHTLSLHDALPIFADFGHVPKEYARHRARHLFGGALFWRRHFADDRRLHRRRVERSEEHTSELQSLMRISYAVFCLKKKIHNTDSARTIMMYHAYQNNIDLPRSPITLKPR